MLTGYYQKKPKKSFQKRFLKGIEIFLMKKKDKKRQYARERYRDFSEQEKQRSINTI